MVAAADGAAAAVVPSVDDPTVAMAVLGRYELLVKQEGERDADGFSCFLKRVIVWKVQAYLAGIMENMWAVQDLDAVSSWLLFWCHGCLFTVRVLFVLLFCIICLLHCRRRSNAIW